MSPLDFLIHYTAALRITAREGALLYPFITLRDVVRSYRLIAFLDRCDAQTIRLAQGARLKGRPWPRTTAPITR